MAGVETAIVPVEDTQLAKPRRFWQRRTPTKVRHYVEFEPPVGEHRPGQAPRLRHEAVRAEDLSLGQLRSDDYGRSDLAVCQFGGQSFLGMLIGGLIIGRPAYGIAIGMAIGSLSGLVTWISMTMTSGLAIKRRLAGRLDETAEIETSVASLALMADGVDAFGTQAVRLPVEALYRGLGHDDANVRQFSAELIVQLPEQVRIDGIAAFSKHLTAEQLALLPGNAFSPEYALAHDKRRIDWPKHLVTMTEAEKG
ncbi:MAG: hypothetical protein V1738_03315 [Patescibacteria group bacterium]